MKPVHGSSRWLDSANGASSVPPPVGKARITPSPTVLQRDAFMDTSPPDAAWTANTSSFENLHRSYHRSRERQRKAAAAEAAAEAVAEAVMAVDTARSDWSEEEEEVCVLPCSRQRLRSLAPATFSEIVGHRPDLAWYESGSAFGCVTSSGATRRLRHPNVCDYRWHLFSKRTPCSLATAAAVDTSEAYARRAPPSRSHGAGLSPRPRGAFESLGEAERALVARMRGRKE